MRFGRDDARRIAALARLSLNDDELDRFAGQLAAVLEHVASLGEAAAAAAVPDDAAPAPPRDDRVTFDPLTRPPASFAPDFEDGFFAVPRIAAFDVERDTSHGDA